MGEWVVAVSVHKTKNQKSPGGLPCPYLVYHFDVKIDFMEIDKTIFRSYDIRGVYPDAVNEKAFFYFGQALSQMVKGMVVVGHDARTSSPSLYHALIRGLSYSGNKNLTILPVGMITTPQLYFLVNKLGAGAGFTITASHNPANENGLKMVGPKAVPIFTTELKKFIEERGEFAASAQPAVIKKAEVGDYYHNLYAAFLVSHIKLKKPLSIVADCSDGAVGMVLRALERQIERKKIPLSIHIINGEPNGQFPAHGPSPMAKGALKELSKEVVERGADCGVIFDSDGDRIVFTDEKGQEIPSDAVAVLLAEGVSGKMVIDPRAGFLVRDYILKNKRKVVVSRVGHAFIKKILKETGATFGAEFSGHYYFKEFFGADSGLFTLAKVFSAISRFNKPLSEWLATFPQYFGSGEVNFRLKPGAKETILEKIEEKYRPEATLVDKLDGVKMEFDGWWLLVRPSGNEDILRLLIEAKDEKVMKAKIKEFSKFIDAPLV